MISAIFTALYTFIIRQRDLILDNLRTRCEVAIQQDPSMPIAADDDIVCLASVYMFLCFRARSCWSRSKMAKRYTLQRKHNLRKQLSVLKLLLETDKTPY